MFMVKSWKRIMNPWGHQSWSRFAHLLSRNDYDARNKLIKDYIILLTCKYIQKRSLTVATNMITGNTHTGEKHYGCNQRDYMWIHTGETAANSMIAGNDTQGRNVIAGKYTHARSLTVPTSVIASKYTQERNLTAATSMIAGKDTQGRNVITGKHTQERNLRLPST